MSPVRFGYDRDAGEFYALAESFRQIPDEFRKHVEYRLRPVGERTVEAVRRNASWSSRIPGAVRLKVAFRGKDPGLIITVDRHQAPHARPYEGFLAESFRHPVFGDTDTWVTQDARRFVWPAVLETQQDVADAVDEALAGAFHAAGFG